MSRINYKTDNPHDEGVQEVQCIKITATKENANEQLLKLLMMVSCKVTGGFETKEGYDVKAALAALSYLIQKDREAFGHAVMLLSMLGSVHISDADMADKFTDMPDDVRSFRETLKEQFLEFKKHKAEEALKKNQAQ